MNFHHWPVHRHLGKGGLITGLSEHIYLHLEAGGRIAVNEYDANYDQVIDDAMCLTSAEDVSLMKKRSINYFLSCFKQPGMIILLAEERKQMCFKRKPRVRKKIQISYITLSVTCEIFMLLHCNCVTKRPLFPHLCAVCRCGGSGSQRRFLWWK